MGEGAPLSQRVSTVLRYGGAVLLLGLVVYLSGGVELPRVLRPAWLVAAAIAFAAFALVLALAWWSYMGRPDQGSWASVFWADQASHVTSLVLPSPTPSLTRLLFLRGSFSPELTLGSTIVDRLNVVGVYGVAVLLAIPLILGAGTGGRLATVVAAVGVGLLILFAALHWTLQRPSHGYGEKRWQRAILPFGGKVEEGSRVVAGSITRAGRIARNRARMTAGLLFQILGVILVQGALSVLLAEGLGMGFPFWAAFLFPTAANALAILPMLPRGLGAVEGAGAALFSAVGVPGTEAVTFMLAHRAFVTLGILALGAWPFVSSTADLISETAEASREGLA